MAGEFNIKNGFKSNGNSTVSGRLTTQKLTITSGATAGYVLTSDVSGNASWASAGGALVYFSETGTTVTPNTTVPVVTLIAKSGATNIDIAIAPKGTGALLGDIPDGTNVGGNKRGQNAVDWTTVGRISPSHVASGDYSVISGGRSNTASGTESICAGGYYNVASGGQSVVVGGEQNTASSTKASVGGGAFNTASSSFSTIGGGNSNQAIAYASFVPGGYGNIASGNYSAAVGNFNTSSVDYSMTFGYGNTASGIYSMGLGIASNTFGIYCRQSLAAGNFSSAGDAQKSTFILRVATTDTTITSLTTNGSGYANGANNYILLQNNQGIRFKGSIIGKQSGTSDVAAWDIDGLIVRGANAVSTSLIVNNVTLVSNLPGWGTPTVIADTTIGCLNVQVSGLASTNIRWVSNIETTEVIYA